MKRGKVMKTNILYVIMALVLGVLGVEGYILYNNYQDRNVVDKGSINDKDLDNDTDNDIDKSDTEEDNNEENKEKTEDGVRLLNTKKESDKIVQEYEIVLNGKINNLNVSYNFDKYVDGFGGDNTDNYCINSKYYTNCNLENKKEEYFKEEYVNNSFNEKNFEIIKGEDNKSYLIIHGIELNLIGNSYYLFVLNDDLEIIKPTESIEEIDDASFLGFAYYESLCEDINCESTGNFWYKDRYGVCSDEVCQIRSKVEDNKIYHLFYVGSCEGVEVEEREYTIKNNKLSYEVINTYQMMEIC